MREASFIVLDSGAEYFIAHPENYELSGQERIVTREVSEERYNELIGNVDKEFKVYRFVEGAYLSRFAPPSEINFRILNLHRKETFEKGLRVQVDYYAHYDEGAQERFDDVVVRERHAYVYMPYRAIPIRRDITIEWLLNDESVGYTKTKTRHFLGTEGAKVHEKRKVANVMNLKAIIFGFFVQALGAEQGLSRVNTLFGYLFQPIETYTKGHEGFLIDAIAAYDEEVFDYPFGGGTLRQYLISELDIPKFIPEA